MSRPTHSEGTFSQTLSAAGPFYVDHARVSVRAAGRLRTAMRGWIVGGTLWRRRCVALAALLAMSCASADRQGGEPPPATGPLKLAVLMFGFFNSENRTAFDPKPIRYAVVNLKEAHGALVERAQGLRSEQPIKVLSWSETGSLFEAPASDDVGPTYARLRKTLDVLDFVVQQRKLPKQDLVQLRLPISLPRGWGAEDRILMIVGLETGRRPDPKGLTSVLGCFWFDGTGSYVAFAAVPYDFTNFGTGEFATASEQCFRFSSEDQAVEPRNAPAPATGN